MDKRERKEYHRIYKGWRRAVEGIVGVGRQREILGRWRELEKRIEGKVREMEERERKYGRKSIHRKYTRG